MGLQWTTVDIFRAVVRIHLFFQQIFIDFIYPALPLVYFVSLSGIYPSDGLCISLIRELIIFLDWNVIGGGASVRRVRPLPPGQN